MSKVIILHRIDDSGVYALPGGITTTVIDIFLLNGYPVSNNRYAIVANGSAVDIFDADLHSIVAVILK